MVGFEVDAIRADDFADRRDLKTVPGAVRDKGRPQMHVAAKALSGDGILAGNRDIHCAGAKIKCTGDRIYLDMCFILGIDWLAISIDGDLRRMSVKQRTRLERDVSARRQKDRTAAAPAGINRAVHIDITCVGGQDKRVRGRATAHRNRTGANPEVTRLGKATGVQLGIEGREIGNRASIQHERTAQIPGRSATEQLSLAHEESGRGICRGRTGSDRDRTGIPSGGNTRCSQKTVHVDRSSRRESYIARIGDEINPAAGNITILVVKLGRRAAHIDRSAGVQHNIPRRRFKLHDARLHLDKAADCHGGSRNGKEGIQA